MVVGDFDGQGGPDAVLVGDGHGTGPTYIMAAGGDFPGSGFAQVEEFFEDARATAVAVGDLNGDSREDIVMVQPNSLVRILMSSGG